MSDIRSSQILTGLLALLLCVAVGHPVLAADNPEPGSTITIMGTDNTEAVIHADVHDLAVVLTQDAALKVNGADAAVSLGQGGTVTLAAGSRISNTQGEEPVENVLGIALNGEDKLGDSLVMMGKGSVVVAEGSGEAEVTAIEGGGASNINVTMDGASLKSTAVNGDAFGLHISDSNTAELSMTQGSTLDVLARFDEGDGEAHGVYIERVAHGVVSLADGSMICVTGVATDGAGYVDPAAILLSEVEIADVRLAGGSQLISVHNADGDSPDPYAYGVSISTADQATVNVRSGSTIDVASTAIGDGAQSSSWGVSVQDVEEAAVILDDHSGISSTATSEGENGQARALGVLIEEARALETAKIILDNASTIYAGANGSEASAAGGAIRFSSHGVAKVTAGSSITATSIATANEPTPIYRLSEPEEIPDTQAMAATSVLGMEYVTEVEVNLNNAEVVGVMQATAESDDSGTAVAGIVRGPGGFIPVGIGAVGYESAIIQLTDARVDVSAEATATSHDGSSRAMVGGMGGSIVSGLLVKPGDVEKGELSRTAILLQRSSIEVTGVATATGGASTGEESQSLAAVSGISLLDLKGEQEGEAPTLMLIDSTVRVSATSSVTKTKDKGFSGALAQSAGILASECSGDTTLTLDHSIVTAEASADMAVAAGIGAMTGEGGNLTINLSNESEVSVLSEAGMMSEEGMVNDEIPPSSAIIVGGNTTINIDSTSSLVGEWAVVGKWGVVGEDDGGPAALQTVNNQGLISGRIAGVSLNNASTGILQASFDSKDGFAFRNDSEAENTFYFMTESATLAAGTTFSIVPDGLEFAKEGGSEEYALLKSATAGDWDQKQLILRAVGDSPLLGLNWSDNSTDSALIAQVTLLSPDEAGLSGNASSAFKAVWADRGSEFLFNTDPEEWSPNVSGAFLTGMTQTLGASHANIGNRLGGLMGLNTGDEIVAANGLWYNAAFTDADQGERDGIEGFDADTAGISLGFDRQSGPVTVGVACTIGKTDADADDGSSSMGMDDNLFSLYGSYDGGKWFSEAVLSAGIGDVDSTRYLDDQILTADYDSTSYNALAKVGMKLNSAGWQVNPLVAVDYSYMKYDSYTEVGGSGALDVESQDYTVLNVGGGASMQRSWVKTWGVLTPEVSAMLRYDLEGDRILTTAKFVGGSTAFVAHGADPAETSWEFSTALTVASLDESAVSVRLGYDYAGREDFSAHSVSGKVRFEF